MRARGRLRGATLLLALVLVSGCAPRGASQQPEPPRRILEPGGKIVVEEASGRIAFSFLSQDTPGRGDLSPSRAVDLVVKRVGEDAVLWSVYARDTAGAAARIVYGIVPPGFVQGVPTNAPAPKLEKGVTYSVAARAGGWLGRDFTFRGD